jgi:hypothetical protein
MAANAPEVQLIADADTTAKIKITGFYNAATGAANTKILTANTLLGADNTKACIVNVERVQFATGLANGYISLEYIGTSNTKIFSFGKRESGHIDGFIPNNATAPTGDLNLFTSALDANDSYSIIVTVRKINTNKCFDALFTPYN